MRDSRRARYVAPASPKRDAGYVAVAFSFRAGRPQAGVGPFLKKSRRPPCGNQKNACFWNFLSLHLCQNGRETEEIKVFCFFFSKKEGLVFAGPAFTRLPSFSVALAAPIIEQVIQHLDARHHNLLVAGVMSLAGRTKRIENFGCTDFVALARPQVHHVVHLDVARPVT